jgi:hypothetical protein
LRVIPPRRVGLRPRVRDDFGRRRLLNLETDRFVPIRSDG